MSVLGERVIPSPGVLVKDLGGEAVLLDLTSETYFGLDRTAFRMWTAVVAAPTVEAAVEDLTREYDVDVAVLREDLVRLVESLFQRGLIRLEHA